MVLLYVVLSNFAETDPNNLLRESYTTHLLFVNQLTLTKYIPWCPGVVGILWQTPLLLWLLIEQWALVTLSGTSPSLYLDNLCKDTRHLNGHLKLKLVIAANYDRSKDGRVKKERRLHLQCGGTIIFDVGWTAVTCQRRVRSPPVDVAGNVLGSD